MGQEQVFLEHIAHPARASGDLLSAQIHISLFGGGQSGEHMEKGGLPRPGHSQYAHQFPLLQVQGDVLDDGGAVIDLGNAPGLQYRSCHGR